SPVHRKPTLGLDLQGGLEVVLKANPPKGHKLTADDLSRSIDIMRNRIDKLGVSEPEIRKQGNNQIVIQLAGVHDPASAAKLIGKTAVLEFYDFEADLTGPSVSSGLTKIPVASSSLFNLLSAPQTQALADKGTPSQWYLFDPQTNAPVVLMQFTGKGKKIFHEITKREAQRGSLACAGNNDPAAVQRCAQHFAIVLDRQIQSVPYIDFRRNPDGIPGDNGAQIDMGGGSLGDAKKLALVLQTGALPVTFTTAERTDVSATLGKDSLNQAKKAALVGLFAVATPQVKGFALMLLIGTVISLISAVAATRAMLGLLAGFSWFNKPRFMGAHGQQTARWLQIDFMRRRYWWFALSGIVLALGAGALGLRGLNLGIDFKGGTQLSFKTAASHTTGDIRSVLSAEGYPDAVIQGRGAST